jgi:hypothetical protein
VIEAQCASILVPHDHLHINHERAFGSAATRHRIDRNCVPYLMSAVKSAAAPNGGSASRRPWPGGKSWVLPSLQPVHPWAQAAAALPGACYLVMAHDAARACRNKGEADAAGLVKSGRLWL